ncbi:hypothetical protein J6590_035542 [Homalodisca vitripennis]|nr:hypothetical protein J6590_035542 [Homalodisca vitripennis]
MNGGTDVIWASNLELLELIFFLKEQAARSAAQRAGIRKKLDAIYEGPYKIIAVISDVSFVVQDLGDANMYKRVHSMNMKLNETKAIPGNEVIGGVYEVQEKQAGQELYTCLGSDCRLSVGIANKGPR